MNAAQVIVIQRLFHQAPGQPSMLLGLRVSEVVGESPPIARWEAWDAMVAYIRQKEGLEKPGIEPPKEPKVKPKRPAWVKRGPKPGRSPCTARNPVTGRKCQLRAGHAGPHKYWSRAAGGPPPEVWDATEE